MATGQLPRLIRPTDRFVQQIEKKATCGTGKQQPRFENDVVVATIMKNLFRVFLSLCIQCPVDCEYECYYCYLWMVAWLRHSCHHSDPFCLPASAFRTTQLHTMPLAEADQHLPSKFCRQGRAYILSQGHCIKAE